MVTWSARPVVMFVIAVFVGLFLGPAEGGSVTGLHHSGEDSARFRTVGSAAIAPGVLGPRLTTMCHLMSQLDHRVRSTAAFPGVVPAALLIVLALLVLGAVTERSGRAELVRLASLADARAPPA